MNTNETSKLPHPTHVLECIDKWRMLDLRKLNDDDFDKELTKFLKKLGAYFTSNIDGYNKVKFWRIRKFATILKDESEFWDPPQKDASGNKCKMGRCNAEGNPVLYVSEKLKTPFEEMVIKPNDLVYLIKYQQIKALKLMRVIPEQFIPKSLNKVLYNTEDILSYQIIRDFIRSEFLKPVGEGTEYLHRISGSICRIWFNDDNSDGWFYPSVPSPSDYNIALKSESAHEKLKIMEIRIVKMVDKEELIKLKNIEDTSLPIFNMMRLVIQSIYKGLIGENGITWVPSNEIGGDF